MKRKRVFPAAIVFITLLLEMLFVCTDNPSYKCEDVMPEFLCGNTESGHASHTKHHTEEKYDIVVPAGPGKNGIKKGACQKCGKTIYSVYECQHSELHKSTIKEPTTTEAGEEDTICNECGTVIKRMELPRISLENNMIYIPQAGIRKEFTQGSYTQECVDASDILYAYAYIMGLGSNSSIYRNTRGEEALNIAYRFRIYPTEEQKVLLTKTFGCCRFLYNQMLQDKIQEYEKTKKMLRNTPAMYKKKYPFLKEVDSLALANVQLHLERAYRSFFRNPKIGFPKFKSRHRSRNSYTTNLVNQNIQVEEKQIKLPKLKWLRIKKHREIPEAYQLKSVTVSMESSGKYFASLLYERIVCENQAEEKDYSKAKILGIDYAMHGMAVFSDDVGKENIGYFRKSEKRLAREQRRLSRCVKGSHNYGRQKKKVAVCHEKIRNQRKDFLHKLSREIADRYDVVAVEDIDMKAMSQCMNFGKSVSDNGYGKFREMLEYKLVWEGKQLVKVDRFFPSSKRCCKCERIKKELKLSDRIYQCECGNEIDRDLNAAINIREEARRILIA